MIELKQIGTVKSSFKEKADPFVMRKYSSSIVIDPEYSEGLYRLSESEYIKVIFGFHKSSGYSLKGPVYSGEIKGVFASRSPYRPSSIGVTTVRLLQIEGEIIEVKGLDAVDGTPVYDIKPYVPVFDNPVRAFYKDRIKEEPRFEMIKYLKKNDPEMCLLRAGTFHGHFCPGLSAGVYASYKGIMEMFGEPSDGMENLIAVTETNSCFADGIQGVAGCTFGNNSLIYMDTGKTAVTFAQRGNENCVRILMKPEFHEILAQKFPEFTELFDTVVKKREGTGEDIKRFKEKGREASFGMLKIPFSNLFEIQKIKTSIPPYAPIFDNAVCDKCGEQLMEAKAVRDDSCIYCRTCSLEKIPSVTGQGIINI
jgi:formylmethanofuran dehydrogenase subunit E